MDYSLLTDEELLASYKAIDKHVKSLSFRNFCLYNRHDVKCIVDLDKKFKYIDLANAMVHEATVNFYSIFGSVQLIDTAIINFCHSVRNEIVFDKVHKPKQHVEGALVLTPKVGLHKKIGSIDIKSLYPSTYRILNLSPEKIIGQLAEYEEGWKIIYSATRNPNDLKAQEQIVTIIPEDSPEDRLEMSAIEFIDFLKCNKFAISGYGTILDQSSGEGFLPAVLTYWFKGRIELQGKKKAHAKIAKAALEKAESWLKENPPTIEERSAFEKKVSAKTPGKTPSDKDILDDKIQSAPTWEEYTKNLELSEYYDMLQGVRKVLLNSSYGATLNEFCRFHDPRLGASTTGSGRQITTHMIQTVAESLIGEDASKIVKNVEWELNKKTGEKEPVNTYTIDVPPGVGPIYSDTDSCYFVMENLVGESIEDAIDCANAVASTVNDSFPPFLREAFYCQPGFDNLIEANREVVATTGIFRAKKKYILLVADMEGTRIDADNTKKSLKSQGSDIKISSTPEEIRTMLKEVLMTILKGGERQVVEDCVMEFRRNLNNNPNINPLDYATVTSVNNLDEYVEKYERIEKPGFGSARMPNNARSAMNHNNSLQLYAPYEKPIVSGMKIKTVWLKQNDHGFDSMAFSSETDVLPQWFKDSFEIDVVATELKLVDQKLKNIFDPIGWQVPTEQTLVVNKLLSFN